MDSKEIASNPVPSVKTSVDLYRVPADEALSRQPMHLTVSDGRADMLEISELFFLGCETQRSRTRETNRSLGSCHCVA